MNKFADFNISVNDKTMFNVPKVSITDLVNKEIEVLDYQANITTSQGNGRYVVKIKNGEIQQKFFTNASPLKDALKQVKKEQFPFATTIKHKSYDENGTKKTYFFT